MVTDSTGATSEVQPTEEERSLSACPIDWREMEGFEAGSEEGFTGALAALYAEWIRCVALNAVSYEEAAFVGDILTDIDFYEPAPETVLQNLADRRVRAVSQYRAGIGRLADLRFLRPSHDGKHFSPGGPVPSMRRSFFYKNLLSSTVGNLFWSWFNDAFALEGDPRDAVFPPIKFLRPYEACWDALTSGRELRIAINTASPIGVFNGDPLHHVALDINLDARVVHAYPVSQDEAQQIMNPQEVRVIKSREY